MSHVNNTKSSQTTPSQTKEYEMSGHVYFGSGTVGMVYRGNCPEDVLRLVAGTRRTRDESNGFVSTVYGQGPVIEGAHMRLHDYTFDAEPWPGEKELRFWKRAFLEETLPGVHPDVISVLRKLPCGDILRLRTATRMISRVLQLDKDRLTVHPDSLGRKAKWTTEEIAILKRG